MEFIPLPWVQWVGQIVASGAFTALLGYYLKNRLDKKLAKLSSDLTVSAHAKKKAHDKMVGAIDSILDACRHYIDTCQMFFLRVHTTIEDASSLDTEYANLASVQSSLTRITRQNELELPTDVYDMLKDLLRFSKEYAEALRDHATIWLENRVQFRTSRELREQLTQQQHEAYKDAEKAAKEFADKYFKVKAAFRELKYRDASMS